MLISDKTIKLIVYQTRKFAAEKSMWFKFKMRKKMWEENIFYMDKLLSVIFLKLFKCIYTYIIYFYYLILSVIYHLNSCSNNNKYHIWWWSIYTNIHQSKMKTKYCGSKLSRQPHVLKFSLVRSLAKKNCNYSKFWLATS